MKLMIMGMAMMGTATYGSTDLFHKAQDVTDNVTAVYATAGEIDHFADRTARRQQQDKLFAMAAAIEPFAQEYGKADPDKIAAKIEYPDKLSALMYKDYYEKSGVRR